MRGNKEAELQKRCVEWLRATFPEWLVFSVPNEATYKRAQYFKSLGMLSGVSDLIVVSPKNVTFVEFKSEKGRMTNTQKNFKWKVEHLGYRYLVVKDMDTLCRAFLI